MDGLVIGEGTQYEFNAGYLYYRYREMGICHEFAMDAIYDGVGDAIAKYDPTKGASFSTFAFAHVRGKFTEYFKYRARTRTMNEWEEQVERDLDDEYDAGVSEVELDERLPIVMRGTEDRITRLVETRLGRCNSAISANSEQDDYQDFRQRLSLVKESGKLVRVFDVVFPKISRRFVKEERERVAAQLRYCYNLEWEEIAHRMELSGKAMAAHYGKQGLRTFHTLLQSPYLQAKVWEILTEDLADSDAAEMRVNPHPDLMTFEKQIIMRQDKPHKPHSEKKQLLCASVS